MMASLHYSVMLMELFFCSSLETVYFILLACSACCYSSLVVGLRGCPSPSSSAFPCILVFEDGTAGGGVVRWLLLISVFSEARIS